MIGWWEHLFSSGYATEYIWNVVGAVTPGLPTASRLMQLLRKLG